MRSAIVILLFIGLVANAQDRVQVLDSLSSEPIPNTNISAHAGIGITTDNEGYFSLNVFKSISDADSLTISSVGYNTRRIPVSALSKNDIIYLLPKEERLKDVIVFGKRIKNKSYLNFKELASMPYGVFSFGAVAANGKIYVIGGDRSIKDEYHDYYLWENNSDKIQMYDIEKNEWKFSKLKFSSRAYHNVHYYNDKIFIIGGKKLATNSKVEYLNDIVEVYNLEKDTIISSKTNPHQTINFASSMYKDNIIVMGGSTKRSLNGKIYSSKMHLFNLTSGFWYYLGDMPFAKETKGIAVNDLVYLIGGFQNKPIRYINSYNISTGEYKEEFKMPGLLERPGLAYHNNIIYIFEKGLIFTFNTLTKKMFAYPTQIGLMYSELIYNDGRLYVIGGLEQKDAKKMPSDKIYSIEIRDFDKIVPYDIPNLKTK